MRASAGVAAALCAGLAVACSGKVDSLPAGAQVTCATDADCPSGLFCSQVLDRCIERGGADQTAPALVTPLPGLEHHLWMLDGELSLEIDGAAYRLKPGDCMRYLLAGPSRFVCGEKRAARYLLSMVRP